MFIYRIKLGVKHNISFVVFINCLILQNEFTFISVIKEKIDDEINIKDIYIYHCINTDSTFIKYGTNFDIKVSKL